MRSDLCAVIPAFQCEKSIGAVVEGVRLHLDQVWVVDDGSSDRTAEIATGAGARVERLERNRGKGFALRRGLALAAASSPPGVLLLDGDGQHDPADIPAFLSAWDQGAGDMLLGNRWGDLSVIPGARYWTNYIGSRVLSWMTGRELLDSQSGYRLLSSDLIRRLSLCSDRYAIETEMLIKAARMGARFASVPVRTIYGEQESHFRPVHDTFMISCAAVYFKVFDDA
ncbi:MAG: glycosyltransferase family 2 protein [Acidobacteriota bacterium]